MAYVSSFCFIHRTYLPPTCPHLPPCRAHVYLSRPIPDKNLLSGIRQDPQVLGRIAGLKEVRRGSLFNTF